MASTKEYLDFILEQLSELDEVSSRAMMGEYILYYRGRIFGGIYDDRLLVKPVPAAVKLMPDAELELPYDGAKEMLLVDDVDNRAFLCELVRSMWEEPPENDAVKSQKEVRIMNTEKFEAAGKEATLYHSKESGSPLVIFNNYAGDGKSVMETAERLEEKDFNLLCIGNLQWDHDMTPWHCPPTSPNETPFTGGADEYLKLLLEEILPECLKRVEGTPSHISIAGYSLAGLFALYVLYRTDVFERAASMSGSLWFPDFKEYVFSHEMKRRPEKLYLSLGDKEARTRNRYMKAVQDNTESIAGHFREAGIDVTFEMNPGNHFKDAELRSVKGILAII